MKYQEMNTHERKQDTLPLWETYFTYIQAPWSRREKNRYHKMYDFLKRILFPLAFLPLLVASSFVSYIIHWLSSCWRQQFSTFLDGKGDSFFMDQRVSPSSLKLESPILEYVGHECCLALALYCTVPQPLPIEISGRRLNVDYHVMHTLTPPKSLTKGKLHRSKFSVLPHFVFFLYNTSRVLLLVYKFLIIENFLFIFYIIIQFVIIF